MKSYKSSGFKICINLQWIAQKFSSPYVNFFFFDIYLFCNTYLKSIILKDTYKPT